MNVLTLTLKFELTFADFWLVIHCTSQFESWERWKFIQKIVLCTWLNLTCTILSLLWNISMTRHNSQDKVKCHTWLMYDLSVTRNLGKISWPILTSTWLQMLTEKLWLDCDIHGTWDFHMTFSDYAWTWNVT